MTKPITIQIDEQVLRQLEEKARKEHRSIDSLIETMLMDYLVKS